MKCECCDENLTFNWCDTHGVGACINCGMPYTIYHYEDGKRVEKEPSIALKPEGLTLAKEYWAEHHRRVFPASFDMWFGRSGRSYSGATIGDAKAFSEWYESRKSSVAA